MVIFPKWCKLRVGLVATFLVATAGSSSALADDGSMPNDQQSREGRPNVLLIVADDLGYSDIGALGSEIPTPNLDQLADEGRVVTSLYVAPTCSPTRAMLMSGTDSHIAGLGTMAELLPRAPHFQGQPGYEGYLNHNVMWLPEVLRDAGYHTYMAGKWHLGKDVGNWPIDRGFESSFALVNGGGGSHFAPVEGKLTAADRGIYVENHEVVELEPDFYSSDSYTDKLISYIKANDQDGKPFFAYAAYTAPHWPLHAPDKDIAKFAGVYDEGYEAVRSKRIERMKQLGLLPEDFAEAETLPPSKDFPNWEMLSPQERRIDARKMEVYAAMVHNMDTNIGRLIQILKDLGEYENTFVMFMSDNGAEAGDSYFPSNEHVDNSLDNIGRPLSNVGYGARWAEVSNAPLRHFKGYTSEGGISAAAIARLPGENGGVEPLSLPAHGTDIAPTILDVAGIELPGTEYKGREIHPVTGESLVPALKQRELPTSLTDRVLGGELFGNRYVRDGKWKLVSVMAPFSDNSWELYNVEADRGETVNLIEQRPDVAPRMVELWDTYVEESGIVFVPNKFMPDIRRGHPPIKRN